MNIRNIWILLITAILLIVSIPLLIFLKYRPNKKLTTKLMHFFTKTISLSAGNKVRIVGQEHLNLGENFLLVANHESMFDVVNIVQAVDEPIGFVSKIENSKIPIFKSMMLLLNSVFLDRNDIRQSTKTLSLAADNIIKYNSLAVLPEGTRSTKQMEFKAGSFKIAQKAKCPIVACTVVNTAALFEERHTIKRQTSKVIFHKPLLYDDYKDLSMVEIASMVEKTIYDSYE